MPAISLFAWVFAGILALRALDSALGHFFFTPSLENEPSEAPSPAPRVSIIFAAKDEGETVKPALQTLLAQDYPDFEVIAVNDRSEDATGDILRSFKDPRLKVLDVQTLPEGWLGKTHALKKGAEAASGEFLLFTDADVHFKPETVRKAVAAASRRGLDSLTLFPELAHGGFLEIAFTSFFIHQFNLRYRPWAARFKWALAYAGIGAFHLVRRSSYQKAGTHERLRLEVADDMMLGKILKRSGARQMAMKGAPLISVRWLSGWEGTLNALHKNAFRGLEYSVAMLLFATAMIFAADVAPFALVFVPACRAWALAMLAALFVSYLAALKHDRRMMAAFPAHGFTALLFLFVLWRSALTALAERGIRWRGTFYPLDELRRSRV